MTVTLVIMKCLPRKPANTHLFVTRVEGLVLQSEI